MIGTVLQDKYKIEKKIGDGAFGTVFRGFDINLKRPVAIKILKTSGAEEQFKKRFLREAESMARMNHPNIVTIYDCGSHDDVPFIVMELVNGPNLFELAKKTSLTITQLLSLAIQVCQGMAYAHEMGMIHRDLSLKNIMIDESEEDVQVAKILDFGLVKLLSTEMASSWGDRVGTPFYMSPEQVQQEEVDGRTDIFSFGAGLFRLLNGRYPFEAEHPTAIMYLIVNEKNLQFAEGVPKELEAIVRKCLDKAASARPANFNELAVDLETLQRMYRGADSSSSVSISELRSLDERTSRRNPYLNRIMIKHPREFFGREREIRKIYSRLDAPHPQSISIVGERRIGKSSLLNTIYNRRNRKKFMQNYKNSIFVYLDFQRAEDYDVPKFIDFLFNMFTVESSSEHDFASLDRNLDKLKDVVHELHDKGKRMIILMDEFERITKNDRFPENFFAYLRSLANSYRVSYVTSSYDELQKMCYNQDISDSPFFNIFSNLPLRPFTHDEAMELIAKPSGGEGVPFDEHAQQIIELSGYFPFFLQIACSSLFEFLLERKDSKPDWKEITRVYNDEVEPHYNFVWDQMDDSERGNLHRIASGKPVQPKYKFITENLVRRGYLHESGKDVKIFSSTFQKFVLDQVAKEKGKKSFFGSLFGKKGK